MSLQEIQEKIDEVLAIRDYENDTNAKLETLNDEVKTLDEQSAKVFDVEVEEERMKKSEAYRVMKPRFEKIQKENKDRVGSILKELENLVDDHVRNELRNSNTIYEAEQVAEEALIEAFNLYKAYELIRKKEYTRLNLELSKMGFKEAERFANKGRGPVYNGTGNLYAGNKLREVARRPHVRNKEGFEFLEALVGNL